VTGGYVTLSDLRHAIARGPKRFSGISHLALNIKAVTQAFASARKVPGVDT
jgi:hypothetical protein